MRPFVFIFPFILLGLSRDIFAQTPAKTSVSFKVEYERKRKEGRLITPADTFYINFDYSYSGDYISLKTKETIFKSKQLDANNVFGSAGYMKIPKKSLKGKVEIYFNDQLLKTMRIKLSCTVVHLEYDKENNKFIWRYSKYYHPYL